MYSCTLAHMRPDRSIVKKAIIDAKGNLSKAAALLGCSRTTLYTWIYQLGLEREAGIRPDRRAELDMRERKDTLSNKSALLGTQLFNRPPASGGTVPVVGAMMPVADLPIAATVKIPESLWRRVKIEAIKEGCTVSQYVQRMLEQTLAKPTAVPSRRKKGERNGGGSE
jgi:hypothetical protein